jgi:hypothetical protein
MGVTILEKTQDILLHNNLSFRLRKGERMIYRRDEIVIPRLRARILKTTRREYLAIYGAIAIRRK